MSKLEKRDTPDPESVVRLRGERLPVVRLSRKAIAGASAAALAVVGLIVVYALQPRAQGAAEELYNTDGVAVADGLAGAPRDYSQVPRLGPPLPGDLGKPILDAQERGQVAELPPVGAAPPSANAPDPAEIARQREEQEREAARASRLFFGTGTSKPSGPAGSTDSLQSEGNEIDQPAQNSTAPASPDHPAEPRKVSLQRLEAAQGNGVLQAGSVIPAALITGIRSDQPGLVTAQVTEHVYDSVTGQRLLIPQGARLIGEYSSDIGFGQRRVLLSWNRLIFPDGRSIELDRQPAADPSGYAGLEDRVDYHLGGVLKAALVSTLLGIGGELGSGGDRELVRALRRGAQDSVNRAGEQIVARELGIRPTLTIRPGYPVRVLLTRDLLLGEDL